MPGTWIAIFPKKTYKWWTDVFIDFLRKLSGTIFCHFAVGVLLIFSLICKCSLYIWEVDLLCHVRCMLFSQFVISLLSFSLNVEKFNLYVITLSITFLWLLSFEILIFLLALCKLYFLWLNFFSISNPFWRKMWDPVHFR